MRKLSVVVPCFNEQETIPIFYKELRIVLAKIANDYQLLFVDDGSEDNTLKIMQLLSKEDPKVNYLSFSRNFGKEAAMLAGMRHCGGDLVVVMDVDLQDPPALLPRMIEAIEKEGYDSVAARRVNRKGEPPIRSLFARMFYALISKLTDVEIMVGSREYRMMTRQVRDSILELNEYHRFSKGIFGWVGYKTKWLEYQNIERVAGGTKYSFWKLFKFALEGIIAFSTVPLKIASVFGIFFSVIAFFIIIVIIIERLWLSNPVAGWASIMCVIVLTSGLQMLFLGIIGEYLARTHMETKARPKYFIKEKKIDK
ncbi:MAG TPA: glycosyltransferase [Firmicutes bacterium]|jgi:glucosyltransferase|nr:glycosyltransferase [Bacillota bacterium]